MRRAIEQVMQLAQTLLHRGEPLLDLFLAHAVSIARVDIFERNALAGRVGQLLAHERAAFLLRFFLVLRLFFIQIAAQEAQLWYLDEALLAIELRGGRGPTGEEAERRDATRA